MEYRGLRPTDALREKAETMPETVAVQTPTRTLTYGELDQFVSGTAWRLQQMCPEEGALVAFYLPRGWQALVLILAAIRAGRVACPISTRTPPHGVARLLRTVSASLLIAEDDSLVDIVPETVRVRTPEACIEAGHFPLEVFPQPSTGQPATIVFTSGSSGASKAVIHSFGNHYFSAKGSNENLPLGPGDRWLLALPLYHVGGLGIVFRCIQAGATVVIAETPRSLHTVLTQHAITHVSLVATQLARLVYEEEENAPATVQAVLVGGSAVSPSLVEEAFHRGYPLYTTYGLTEMTSQVTTTPPGAPLSMLATSGKILPYRQVFIADDGEILVRGATLFQGYLEQGTLHTPMDEQGWFRTGDRGWVGPDGMLRVIGRSDNMFISGGENIHPEEIEQWLCTRQGVRQAIVVPVEDETYGQRPVAFVDVEGPLPAKADFEAFLEGVLPRFKIPEAFYPWPTIDTSDDTSDRMKVDRMYFIRYAQRQKEAEK